MDSVEEAGAFCGTCRLSKHNREIFHGNAKRNDRPAEIKLRLSGMPDFFFFSRIRTQNATNREREREREREKKPWHSKHGLKPPYEFITVRLRAFFLRTSALRMIYCDRGYSTRLEESSSLHLSGFSLIKARRFLADLSWDSLTDKSFRRILLISPLSNN